MNFEIIELPKITDPRGSLSFIEREVIPFSIQRVYFLYDIPCGTERGGHAHKEQKQLLIAINGSFDVILDDGKERNIITLDTPTKGLLIRDGWRELKNFSTGAVCLVLSSGHYDESDYIRNYNDFLAFKGSLPKS